MTRIEAHGAAIMRAADTETLIGPSSALQLLLDSSATGGALSAHRVRLGDGADGANPHRHRRSSELFYVLEGMVDLLAGEDIITATAGDLVVVPPGSGAVPPSSMDGTGDRFDNQPAPARAWDALRRRPAHEGTVT